MQKADLSLLFPETSRQLLNGAMFAPQVVDAIFYLVPGGYVVSKPVILPRIRKTSLGATTFPKVSDAQYQLLPNSCQEEKR